MQWARRQHKSNLYQKLSLKAVLLVLVLAAILPIYVNGRAAADTVTATWQSKTTIQTSDGNTYTSQGTKTLPAAGKGKYQVFFRPPPDSLSCSSYIYFLASQRLTTATTAKLITMNKTAGDPVQRQTGCSSYEGTISNVKLTNTQANPVANPASSKTDDPNTIDPCDATSDPLSWVVCPVVGMLHEATNAMQGVINHLMIIDVKQVFDKSTDTGHAYYNAWSSFRIFAVVLIVIAGLIMVISQALGMEIFDAYTVKKVLPRLFIAAIFISLSWWILEFLVMITDDIGIAIRSIIYMPFKGLADQYGGMQNWASLLFEASVGVGAFALLGIGGILSLIATAALAALVAFLVLVIRQIVITFLILIAPLAIACLILPNTQKAYHLWWDSLFKALLMFPIIAAFIAAGQVFSVVASSDPNGAYSINNVVALIAYFIPYFALPFTFRLAGGAIGTIGGLVNDRSRGAFDRLKKYRAGQVQKRGGYYAQRAGDRAMQARAEAVRRLNTSASGKGRLAGGAMRFAGRQIAGLGGIEAKMSAINARTSKEINDQIATGDDSDIRGLTVNRRAARTAGALTAANGYNNGLMRQNSDGSIEYKSLGGAWVGESDVIEGHRKWGHDVAAQQAALSYEMRKANSEEQVRGISDRFQALAEDEWGQTKTQAGGSWIGASFENQNQHLEYKSTNWQTGQLKASHQARRADGSEVQASGLLGTGLVDETYEKRGSYNLAQMGSNTPLKLQEAYVAAGHVLAGQDHEGNAVTYTAEQQAVARDQQEKIQAIAETFMHQYGGVGGDEDTLAAMHAEAEGRGGAGRMPTRQANTPGAAHTAERVRELAVMTGVYAAAPTGEYTSPQGRGSSENPRPQT